MICFDVPLSKEISAIRCVVVELPPSLSSVTFLSSTGGGGLQAPLAHGSSGNGGGQTLLAQGSFGGSGGTIG